MLKSSPRTKMPLNNDTTKAVEYLEQFREKLKSQGEYEHENEIAAIVQMLDSPLFRQIIRIQDSMKELKDKVDVTPSFNVNDFDFSPTGELIYQPGAFDQTISASSSQVNIDPDDRDFEPPVPFWQAGINGYPNDISFKQSDFDHYSNSELEIASQLDPSLLDSAYASDVNFLKGLEAAAQGRELETIKLVKPEEGGLGFSVVGLKSENRGELGIFVQDIQPGGVADRGGRLRESDQILAINGERIDTGVSHQEAIALLQRTQGFVELIVARGGIPHSAVSRTGSEASSYRSVSRSVSAASSISATSIPCDETLLDKTCRYAEVRQAIDHYAEDGVREVVCPSCRFYCDPLQHCLFYLVGDGTWRQIETIELHSDGSGFGFGIIGGKNTGVIVKTILPGGVADRDGRLKSGDHILQINDVNLGGMGSDEVASSLRKAGNQVKLVISRIVAEEPPEIPIRPENEEYEVETFEVKLQKNEKGLGITIAGYVGDRSAEELSGIFIKNIAEGSAAAKDGRLQVDDQIVEVDGQSLDGMNNLQAVEVLRNTSTVVNLIIARVKPKQENDVVVSKDVTMNEIVLPPTPPSEPESEFAGPLAPDVEKSLTEEYQRTLGDDVEIFAVQFSKFHPTGGLGISLEGASQHQEGNPLCHRIHSVYSDGPVGKTGLVKAGDYIVEINGVNALSMMHSQVVSLIQGLEQDIRLIIARKFEDDETLDEDTASESTVGVTSSDSQSMWGKDITSVELIKGDRGLGFSILDYQDPQNPSRTVIVIKSLVPGGPAEQNGGMSPGDQLTSVNGVNLENASLDIAVQTLKATPTGKIVIGVRKPSSIVANDEIDKKEKEISLAPKLQRDISAENVEVTMPMFDPDADEDEEGEPQKERKELSPGNHLRRQFLMDPYLLTPRKKVSCARES